MSDSRSSLDIIESEDASLICLSQDLDAHTNHLRNAVLQSVAAIRSKIHSQTAESLDRQRERAQGTERQLLAQIESLQDLLQIRTCELAVVSNKYDKLLALHQDQKVRAHTKAVAIAAMRRWHDLAAKKKANQAACEMLIAQRRERSSRQAFNAWRLATQRHKAEELLQKTVSDHRRATVKLQHEHQAAENHSRMELLSLKEKLAGEEERRDILEEKLKAAFMRGVCALNLEAMQVLRSTADCHQQDVSVASLLQGLQLGSQTSAKGSATDSDASSVDVAQRNASSENFLSQQLALNNQLLQGGVPSVVAPHNISDARNNNNNSLQAKPSNESRPSSAAVAHQAFVVNVNPNYPVQRGGTTLTSTATRGPSMAKPVTSARSTLRK